MKKTILGIIGLAFVLSFMVPQEAYAKRATPEQLHKYSSKLKKLGNKFNTYVQAGPDRTFKMLKIKNDKGETSKASDALSTIFKFGCKYACGRLSCKDQYIGLACYNLCPKKTVTKCLKAAKLPESVL